MSSPMHFVDSQDEDEMRPELVVSTTRPHTLVDVLPRVTESIKGLPLSPALSKIAVFPVSPASARRGVKTTPKARLRHDDSQIQFAAIESSPLQSEPVESQLTDRQKEVKERQGREAAAMFPEIRSSPRGTSHPTEYVLPKLVFKPSQNQDLAEKRATNEETSPTYLPDALMNDFLGSSPTPSSKRSSDRRSDDDPPSSPPLIPQNFQKYQRTDASIANEHRAPVQLMTSVEKIHSSQVVNGSLASMKGHLSSHGRSTSADKDDPKPEKGQEDASNLEAQQAPNGVGPVTDFYVNAPSVPSVDEPSAEHAGNQAKDVVNSFQSEGSSRFSEDDQVTAQLFTEMERASQQSAKQDEIAQSIELPTKKRKRTADSPNVQKKTKRALASLDSQAAAEIPPPSETIADCVMIDVREVDRSRPVLAQQFRRELSASPAVSTSIQAIEETPVAEKTAVDQPMDSEAHQSSAQEYSRPMTPKKAIGRPRGSRNSQVEREEAEKESASALRKSTRVSERLGESITSTPHMSPAVSQDAVNGGQWFALGKTPRRGMFKWLRRGSTESEDFGNFRPTGPSTNERNAEGISEHSRMENFQRNDISPANHQAEDQRTSQKENGGIVTYRRDGEAPSEERGGDETEGEAASAAGILERFQSMLENIKRVALRPEEERAMVNVLFDCVKEVHEAGRRHTSM